MVSAWEEYATAILDIMETTAVKLHAHLASTSIQLIALAVPTVQLATTPMYTPKVAKLVNLLALSASIYPLTVLAVPLSMAILNTTIIQAAILLVLQLPMPL